jgi:hypothetical protein
VDFQTFLSNGRIKMHFMAAAATSLVLTASQHAERVWCHTSRHLGEG